MHKNIFVLLTIFFFNCAKKPAPIIEIIRSDTVKVHTTAPTKPAPVKTRKTHAVNRPVFRQAVTLSVTFEKGSKTVTDSGKKFLCRIPWDSLSVTGSADSLPFAGMTRTESRKRNLRLSQARAGAVKYILLHACNKKAVSAQYAGESPAGRVVTITKGSRK